MSRISYAARIDRLLADATPLVCPRCGGSLFRWCGLRWLLCVNAGCKQRPIFKVRQ